MKRYLLFLVVILCLSCDSTETSSSDLVEFIPRKASIIIKTYDLDKFITAAKTNTLLQGYNNTGYAEKLSSYSDLLGNFTADQESLIALTQIGKDDFEISFITEQTPNLFVPDSTRFTVQKLNTTKPAITKVTTEQTSFYTVTVNNNFIASSSQLLLENTIREKETSFSPEKTFLKAYNASNDKAAASILIKGSEASNVWSFLLPKASKNSFKDAYSWLQADIDLTQDDLKMNGVVLVKDSAYQYLELFKNTNPQINKAPQVTPLGAKGLVSISYDNWDTYKKNLAEFKKIDPSKFIVAQEELLSSFQEITFISLEEGVAIAAVPFDQELTVLALAGNQEVVSTFRQVPFYSLDSEVDEGVKNAFAKAYSEILPFPKVSYYCKLDDFYIFAPETVILENIVANFQNKATLASSKAFQNTSSQLSRASSMLCISNTNKIPFESLTSEKDAKNLKAVSLENYPFAALQLVQDNGFMHLQAVLNKNESPLQDGVVAQVASIKLDEAIMSAPQLVKNHRTKGMDIVLQDQTNNLYLLSNAGKILWKRELESPIIGNIQQVDLYRNGRLQLAFVTENTFYILDRNGKNVAPFPIKFGDTITQPLAIFDYEKNRNYRFVVIQTDKVTMYDKAAKKVTGFTFSKAPDEIILPPQHLRIGNKDYITVTENSGKLNILSRTGKSRIEVAERINFGETEILKNGTNFATYDVNGEKVIITSAGKVTTSPTEYGSDSKIIVVGKITACLRENILYINANKITLPFGSYTSPTINTVKGKSYISITNMESNQVYLYSSEGQSLENFPVYGVAPASIGHLERDKNLGLVTQGDARTVLVYRIN